MRFNTLASLYAYIHALQSDNVRLSATLATIKHDAELQKAKNEQIVKQQEKITADVVVISNDSQKKLKAYYEKRNTVIATISTCQTLTPVTCPPMPQPPKQLMQTPKAIELVPLPLHQPVTY